MSWKRLGHSCLSVSVVLKGKRTVPGSCRAQRRSLTMGSSSSLRAASRRVRRDNYDAPMTWSALWRILEKQLDVNIKKHVSYDSGVQCMT